MDKIIKVSIPKAPEAAAFQRYGDIPVDYATGVPSIQFPVYQINAGKIALPIALSYHASGIRVGDVASSVGLGFLLKAGGRINRTIIDKDDWSNPPFFKTPQEYVTAKNLAIQTSANAADIKLQELADKLWYDKTYADRMTDRYSLFLPNGKSVIFRRNFSTGVFEQMPFENLKIELEGPGFKVTDIDGTIYRFYNGDSEGWNLTKIETPGTDNFIDLTYGETHSNLYVGKAPFIEESGPYAFASSYTGSGTGQTCWNVNAGPGVTYINQYYTGAPPGGSTNNLVTKISNDDVEVTFTYVGGRYDPGTRKLTAITVIDKLTGEQRKKVQFTYSNFGNMANKTWRLKLTSFSVLPTDNSSAVHETHQFGYIEDVVLPPYYDPNAHPYNHEDYWGYYNGTSTLRNIPVELVKNSSNGSDRYPNPAFSIACSLKEVTYPTGGKTVYEMENNYGMQYEPPLASNTQNGIGYAGGLRVKAIKNYAADGKLAWIKTYEYAGGSTKSINPSLFAFEKRIVKPLDPFCMGLEMNRTFAVAEPVESLGIGGNPSVIYGVKEYNGTLTDNTGYTEYGYDLPPRQEQNAYEFPNLLMKHAWQWDYGDERPLYRGKRVHKKNDGGGYTLLQQEICDYTAFNQRKFPTGINVVQATTYVGYEYWIELNGTSQDVTTCANCSFCLSVGPSPANAAPGANNYFSDDNIFAVETSGYVASHLLTKKTTHVISKGVYLTDETDYEYDPNTLLLRSQKNVTSKGENRIVENRYPSDFSSQAPYSSMVGRHELSPVVEQAVYKNSVSPANVLQLTKTNYNYWKNNAWGDNSASLIVPQTVEQKAGTGALEVRARYFSYDERGNPTCVSKENDVPKAYLWGYNKTYPVAEVIGASYAAVLNLVDHAILNNPASDAVLRNELNNLRNSLAGSKALVTAYTYRPLIGISSQTDANGRTTYYEYDAFGRLSLIRDKDNKVLKKFDYKYAGQ